MVYKKFEKNYKIYRTTWSGDAEAFEATEAAAAREAKTQSAREAPTTSAATTTSTTATLDVAIATTTATWPAPAAETYGCGRYYCGEILQKEVKCCC